MQTNSADKALARRKITFSAVVLFPGNNARILINSVIRAGVFNKVSRTAHIQVCAGRA